MLQDSRFVFLRSQIDARQKVPPTNEENRVRYHRRKSAVCNSSDDTCRANELSQKHAQLVLKASLRPRVMMRGSQINDELRTCVRSFGVESLRCLGTRDAPETGSNQLISHHHVVLDSVLRRAAGKGFAVGRFFKPSQTD